MTRAAKIVYVSALIVGLLAGAFAEFHEDLRMLKDSQESRDSMIPLAVTDFWFLQYKYSDPKDAKASLLSSASLLEEMYKANPKTESMGELGDIYMHLAILADAENDPEQSHAYMIEARSWWPNPREAAISDGDLKAAVKKTDDKLPH
jgi:hypothetical protein